MNRQNFDLVQWVRGEASTSPVNEVTKAYTIGTLVSSRDQYESMCETFICGGFGGDDVEYIAIDNTSGNTFDAYAGINHILDKASGRRVIVCHQDVRLIDEGRADLDSVIANLERLDPNWAVVGNAGAFKKTRTIRISDPHGDNRRRGTFPRQAHSFDENFLVFNSAVPTRLSKELSGFHLYGTDCSLSALLNGNKSYVVDFHLRHLSGGTLSSDYYECLNALERHYFGKLDLGEIRTTCGRCIISKSPTQYHLLRIRRGLSLATRAL